MVASTTGEVSSPMVEGIDFELMRRTGVFGILHVGRKSDAVVCSKRAGWVAFAEAGWWGCFHSSQDDGYSYSYSYYTIARTLLE